MIRQYMDFFITELLPELFSFLDTLMIANGVSFLGLTVAVVLLVVVIGAVLMRV